MDCVPPGWRCQVNICVEKICQAMRNQIGSIQQSHLRILEPPQQSLAVAIMVENSFKTYQKRKVPSRVRGFYCSGFGTNRSARFLSPTRSFHDLLGCALCCCCFGSLLCFGHGFGFPRFVLGPAAGRTTLRTEVAPGTPINLGTIICIYVYNHCKRYRF